MHAMQRAADALFKRPIARRGGISPAIIEIEIHVAKLAQR